MQSFKIKTYRIKQEFSAPHFFILNKGLNSGKPLSTPCPNCFVCIFENEEDKNKSFWICYSLWKSNSFHFIIRGSVIPFITIEETRKTILNATLNLKSKNIDFIKTIDVLKQIDQNERNLKESLKKVQELKKVFLVKILM